VLLETTSDSSWKAKEYNNISTEETRCIILDVFFINQLFIISHPERRQLLHPPIQMQSIVRLPVARRVEDKPLNLAVFRALALDHVKKPKHVGASALVRCPPGEEVTVGQQGGFTQFSA
jgi:hypothetical protein